MNPTLHSTQHHPTGNRARSVGARCAAIAATALLTGGTFAVQASAAPAHPHPSALSDGMATTTAALHSRTISSIIAGNEKAAFNYFRSKGLTAVQAAGVVGNLDQESGMDPTIKQYGGGPGRGIAQWGTGGRWDTYANDNVVQYARNKGVSSLALQTQLDFVWYELTQYSYYGLGSLKASTSISAAVYAFQSKFEGCGTCDNSKRVAYANAAYKAYA